MRIVMFYHSLVSDWNHGNAHFLRGMVSELLARGHEVKVFEPRASWSRQNLLAEHGEKPIQDFHAAYPNLEPSYYDKFDSSLERALEGADRVIVHEWNEPDLVARIGEHRQREGGYELYFHDTHHRMISQPDSMSRYDLSNYDGVLAYGEVLEKLYLSTGKVRNAWTWHEAADIRRFRPLSNDGYEGDLVWIGNWGDDERTAELREFLIDPCRRLKLKARVYGVRYPAWARKALDEAGIEYGGWLPNFEVPRVFAHYKVTLHIPRRPYVTALPGIPTIRPFEALACGIPLVCSPWKDSEHLFSPGRDFLMARDGDEMTAQIKTLLEDETAAKTMAKHGLSTLRRRHTCAHRADQFLAIKSGKLSMPAFTEPSDTSLISRTAEVVAK